MLSAIRSLALLCLLAASSFQTAAADELTAPFSQAPAATKPRCDWYWMNGHISKDLEPMICVGSGVQIGLCNSPDWGQTGGPWERPEQAMRCGVLMEMAMKGTQSFSAVLPAPQEGFQPLSIQGLPAPAGECAVAAITSRTMDAIAFPMPDKSSARSLSMRPTAALKPSAELQAAADGTNHLAVRKFWISRHSMQRGVGPLPLAPTAISFPATNTPCFTETHPALMASFIQPLATDLARR